MKRTLSLLLAMLMLAGMLVGCQETPASPADTTELAETTPADTTEAPETEPPVVEKQPYEEAVVTEFDGYTVTLEAPIVVAQGNEGDDQWGHTNFPYIRRTANGHIFVGWLYGEDVTGAKNNINYRKLSMNEGKSWLPIGTGDFTTKPDQLMKNGKYWVGFIGGGTPTSAELAAQIPASEKLPIDTGHYLLFAEDLEKYDLAKELNLTGLSMREYDPETDTYETVECTVNWPYASVTLFSTNLFYSVGGAFGLSGSNVIVAEDGTMYTCIYMYGFNADAETRAEAITEYTRMGKYYTYVFESPDCGRTWNYLAQFYCGDEVEGWEKYECYCEPKMIEMPDGSLFMLMRTSSDSPMYSTVSHDKGRTWTTPEQFDYCGVLPQLLRLENGVTIASYGRPDLFIRTTDDPTGDVWDEHIEVPLANAASKNAFQKSCFYTSLLKIDENSAWIAYTDFKYPNRNGVPVKTVLIRKITVTVNE